MAAITGSLTPQNRKIVGEALQGALVDLLDLTLLAKQAHWNVIGHNFRSVHLHLDEIVKVMRKHTDTVAERASAIGAHPDGRASTVVKTSHVPQLDGGSIEDGKVVAAMTDILESIIARMRERIEVTAETDPVTQDLLDAVAHDLEKHHWMMQAQR
ncbi:Dps family protein [Sinosporangium siamense]|uniref:DNA starvation/stationary phase protection protein n=1 Tax=Sinosporangium siamense TaxID=1367973 RepID=A0A919V4X7_9ACTN|nr:DNA starvation/stationary phase protection protein [Sinosporangium siamense]GII90226.1 DNA starvation/stationary phase protection protein [Sinosporangium siamense]